MTVVSLVICAVFVVGVLVVVGYALFELTPLAHSANPYRDPETGRRRFASPHLEGKEEFEHRTHDDLR